MSGFKIARSRDLEICLEIRSDVKPLSVKARLKFHFNFLTEVPASVRILLDLSSGLQSTKSAIRSTLVSSSFIVVSPRLVGNRKERRREIKQQAN